MGLGLDDASSKAVEQAQELFQDLVQEVESLLV